MSKIDINITIPEELANRRLDAVVAELVPEHSRARIQQWIKDGHLLVDGKILRAREKTHGEEHVEIKAEIATIEHHKAEDIDLDILFSDDDIIVINKPVGLVTHPGAGNHDGTLLNALLFHFPELNEIPRAGIVHRLDKDTSGVMVVARSLATHTKLVADLQARDIKREYLALIPGYVTAGSTIDAPIGRHPRNRLKMAAVPLGKDAVTHYRLVERLPHHTLLRVNLETGRTHQIRVHLEHRLQPIVGDQLYGTLRLPKKARQETREALRDFKRQALHAYKLGLQHPVNGEDCEFMAPIPDDINDLLAVLRQDTND
jgi:23S rRNA pseudouridine1911/1915/1917 synthase